MRSPVGHCCSAHPGTAAAHHFGAGLGVLSCRYNTPSRAAGVHLPVTGPGALLSAGDGASLLRVRSTLWDAPLVWHSAPSRGKCRRTCRRRLAVASPTCIRSTAVSTRADRFSSTPRRKSRFSPAESALSLSSRRPVRLDLRPEPAQPRSIRVSPERTCRRPTHGRQRCGERRCRPDRPEHAIDGDRASTAGGAFSSFEDVSVA